MRNRYAALICPTLFFIGCLRPYSVPAQIQLDSLINGDTVVVSPSEKISLRLNVDADAGYQWDYQITDTTVVMTDAPPTVQPPNGVVGGTAIETFYFRVLREGQCAITFHELREWEQGVPPISTVKFLVVANH